MIKNLKKKYAKWLFRKYGFSLNGSFEHIPAIYKLCPLFSPTLYSQIFIETLNDGFCQGLKKFKEEE